MTQEEFGALPEERQTEIRQNVEQLRHSIAHMTRELRRLSNLLSGRCD